MTATLKMPVPNFAIARHHMIEGQLRPNKITDLRLIEAMGRIPREVFVPSTLVGVAYGDDNIPLISGRALIQPMALAQLVQAAEITPTDHILDLASATGYSTLVLASLGAYVVGVEPDALLQAEASKNIAIYASGKAEILAGAPVEGCNAKAPFDVIMINGSVEVLPKNLLAQLAEGGRLVAVMRHSDPAHVTSSGDARVYRKIKGKVSWTSLFDANLPPAPSFGAPQGFVF